MALVWVCSQGHACSITAASKTCPTLTSRLKMGTLPSLLGSLRLSSSYPISKWKQWTGSLRCCWQHRARHRDRLFVPRWSIPIYTGIKSLFIDREPFLTHIARSDKSPCCKPSFSCALARAASIPPKEDDFLGALRVSHVKNNTQRARKGKENLLHPKAKEVIWCHYLWLRVALLKSKWRSNKKKN